MDKIAITILHELYLNYNIDPLEFPALITSGNWELTLIHEGLDSKVEQ